MPPIVLIALQALFLLLLYLFVARAVRAVLRDLRAPAPSARQQAPPRQPVQQRATAPAPGAPRTGGAAAQRARSPAQAAATEPRRRGATPRQLVVHHPDAKPQVVDLDGGEVRLGRSPTCQVTVRDSYASDRHARVFPHEGGWALADTGSTNGTYLNRQRLQDTAMLSSGDTFTVGKTVVEVRR